MPEEEYLSDERKSKAIGMRSESAYQGLKRLGVTLLEGIIYIRLDTCNSVESDRGA